MDVEFVLSKLDKVRVSGGDKWIACCPAHEDKSPSLSIKDCGDKIALHCFAGCTFEEICSALDIKPQHLFADRGNLQAIARGPSRSLIEAVSDEALVLYHWAFNRLDRKPESDDDRKRVQIAFQRLQRAGGFLR